MLAPYEGLTLVLSWPKGLVQKPGALRRLGYILRDNLGLLLALLALAGVLHVIRLARWQPQRTLSAPLVTVLHVGYAFIPLGFLPSQVAIQRQVLLEQYVGCELKLGKPKLPGI